MSIDQTISKLKHGRILNILILFPLRIRNCLLYHFLFLQMSTYWSKITLVKLLYDMILPQYGFEVGHEVLNEYGCGFGIAEVHTVGIHGSEECRSTHKEEILWGRKEMV
jgi:hypothetical protein